MLPPFNLPSDPAKKITLREANVSDCIDFAGVTDDHEEEVTTLFLNRVQDKACYLDSATWTGEDRRFALLWYWLHTTKDPEVGHSYECSHCGASHAFLLNYNRFFEEYQTLEGKPERDIEFDGQKIIVRPLNGADLEALECMRLALEGDETSGDYKKQLSAVHLERFERCLEFVQTETVIQKVKEVFRGHRTKPEQMKLSRLADMPFSKFEELAELVYVKLAEMEHGLKTVYIDGQILLVTPPHECPATGGMTRLRVPFRNSDQVPVL